MDSISSTPAPQPTDRATRNRYVVRRTRVNTRFFLSSLAVAAALAVLVWFVHGWQVARNANALLMLAQEAIAEGRTEAAIGHLHRFLELQPHDMQATADLAALLDDESGESGRDFEAFTLYEELLRNDPQRTATRRRIVQLAMQLERPREALVHWRELPSDADAELLYQGGQIFEALADYAGAARLYRKAIELQPPRVEFHLALIQLISRRGDELPLEAIDPTGDGEATLTQVTERLLQALVEQGRPRDRALLARAEWRRDHGSLDEAAQDIEAALRESSSADILLLAADIHTRKAAEARRSGHAGDADREETLARQLASRGTKAAPTDLRFCLRMADIELRSDRLAEAESHLRQGLELAGERGSLATQANGRELWMQLQWALADLLIFRSESASGEEASAPRHEAQALVAELRHAGAKRAHVDFLTARLQIGDRQWAAACKLLENVRADLNDQPELLKRVDLALGQCYRELGNVEGHLDAWRRAIEDDPLWAIGRMELAAALASVNRIDEALQQYSLLQDNFAEVRLFIAQLLVRQQLRLPPERRRWTIVYKAIDAGEEQSPDSLGYLLLRTSVLVHQKNFHAAQVLLEKEREARPKEIAIWTTLIELWLQRDDSAMDVRVQSAVELLAEARKALGDSVKLQLLQATAAGMSANAPGAATLAQLERGLDRWPLADQVVLLEGIARAYAQLGETEPARANWLKLARLQPHHLGVRLILAEDAARTGDLDAMQEHLRVVRQVEGQSGAIGDYLEAAVLVAQAKRDPKGNHDLDQAQSLLERAAVVRPQWSAVARLSGVLDDLRQNRDAAGEHYRQAIELGDRAPEIIARLVQILYEQKQYDEADAILQRLTEENPRLLTGDVGRIASRVAFQRRELDRALGLADKVADNTLNFDDLIWLSRLRKAKGAAAQDVEEPLRQAVALAPEHPEPWVALVAALQAGGKTKAARAAIEDARRKLPPEKIPLTLARCADLLGDHDTALRHYEEVLAKSPGDPQTRLFLVDFLIRRGAYADADRHLKAILAQDKSISEGTRAAIQRRRSLILAISGSYDDGDRALKLIEQGRSHNKELSPADLRFKAAILMRRTTRKDRQALIAVLEELGRRQLLTSADRFQLAGLQALDGNRTESHEILRSLLTVGQPRGFLAAWYTRSLIEQQQFEEAEEWLKRLEEWIPQSYLLADLQARQAFGRGRAEAAVAIVTAHLSDRQSLNGSRQALQTLQTIASPHDLLASLEAFFQLHPDPQAEGRLETARQHLVDGQLDLAHEELRRSLQICTSDARLRLATLKMAVQLFEKFGQSPRAEQLLRESLPTLDFDAMHALVSIVARHNQPDAALRLCDEAQERFTRAEIGRMFVTAVRSGNANKEQVGRATSRLDVWLSEEPSRTDLLTYLADIHDYQQNYDECETLYERILKLDSKHVVALNNLAYLLAVRRHQGLEALPLINRAISAAGPLPALLDTRAAIYLAFDEPGKALGDLEAALSEKRQASIFIRIAQAHLRNKNRTAARQAVLEVPKAGEYPPLHPLDIATLEEIKKQLYQSKEPVRPPAAASVK